MDASLRQPLGSLFEPDQPNPTSAVALPTPAGNPQLVSAPATHRPGPRGWLRLALALTLALGRFCAGFVLGRQVATPACLETAKRGDELIALLINNKRTRAAKLLVPYHVASRQCARDAGP